MADIWDSARGVLGAVAPLLATALGGPLAGTATSAVISALGLAPDTPPEQVAEVVKGATPDQLLALKQADNTFRADMKRLEIDEAKLTMDDRAGARAQTVALATVGSSVQWAPAVISFVVLVTFGCVMWAALTRALPAGSETILNMLLGTLAAMATSVVSYWVGSSAGSAAKTDLLAKAQPIP